HQNSALCLREIPTGHAQPFPPSLVLAALQMNVFTSSLILTLLQERTPRTFIAPCAPEPAGVRSARRPGEQRVRMQSATWGGFRHEQAVGAAATGDRSRSKGGFMGSEHPPLPFSTTQRGVCPTNFPNNRTCRRLFPLP